MSDYCTDWDSTCFAGVLIFKKQLASSVDINGIILFIISGLVTVGRCAMEFSPFHWILLHRAIVALQLPIFCKSFQFFCATQNFPSPLLLESTHLILEYIDFQTIQCTSKNWKGSYFPLLCSQQCLKKGSKIKK